MVKVGDLYPVWWSTGVREGEQNMAMILEIRPYDGRWQDDFTHILKLKAPNTDRGWLEMTVKLEET